MTARGSTFTLPSPPQSPPQLYTNAKMGGLPFFNNNPRSTTSTAIASPSPSPSPPPPPPPAVTSTSAANPAPSTSPIPNIAPWQGVTSNRFLTIRADGQCWEANTLAVGARLTLAACNEINPTQSFNVMSIGQGQGIVLTAAINAARSLCVELGTNNFLSFQECRNGYSRQQLVIQNNGRATTFDGSNLCIGNNSNFLASRSCNGAPTYQVVPVARPPISNPPSSVVSMNIGGLCLDGSNPSAVTTVSCNANAASQRWYTLWGQIRNVENGLCLDVPATTSNDRTARQVTLSACSYTSRTQVWIKSASNSLVNAVSGNCIHQEGGNARTGTGLCRDGQDSLRGPKTFTGIDSFTVSLGSAQCQTPRVRKDFRDLSAAEQQTFMDALNTLQRIPSLLGRRNRYHDYVALHGLGGQYFHGTPFFLPWHRFYLAILEQDLQRISGNASLSFPYWAWGADAGTWHRASTGILTADRFGTTGRRTSGGCVQDGFMRGQWTAADGQCVIRGYDDSANGGDAEVTTYGEDFILLAIQTNPNTRRPYTDFDSFRRVIETLPHNSFHMAVAGDNDNSQMGDPRVSVFDPIFWMHHANIDRHWQYFQNQNPSLANRFDGSFANPPRSGNIVPVSMSDVLLGFNVPASSGFAVRQGALCHSFQPFSRSIASVSVQFSRLARRAAAAKVSNSTVVAAPVPDKVVQAVSQMDAAVRTDIVPPAAKEAVKALAPPPRVQPKKLSDRFLDRMAEWMTVDKEEVRRMEENALNLVKEIQAKTDEVLKEEFGKSAANATFEQNAVAVKVAVANLVVEGEQKA
ncbi:hypothetical protein HDU96_007057 [Phlyctochytrium bullatum]|nr:hypothetical protein HDU96_007057 [Phlyctochytrium bullatum]